MQGRWLYNNRHLKKKKKRQLSRFQTSKGNFWILFKKQTKKARLADLHAGFWKQLESYVSSRSDLEIQSLRILCMQAADHSLSTKQFAPLF